MSVNSLRVGTIEKNTTPICIFDLRKAFDNYIHSLERLYLRKTFDLMQQFIRFICSMALKPIELD